MVKGYNAHQQKAEIARSAGLDGAVKGFKKAARWGTPDKIIRGLRETQTPVWRFRVEHRLPFRWHASSCCGERLEALCERDAPGLEVLVVLLTASTG